MKKKPIVVITGASGGIGSVVVKQFVNAGYFVVGTGRKPMPQSLLGLHDFDYVQANLQDSKEVEVLFQYLRSKGAPVAVVHFAGILLLKSSQETSSTEWEEVIQTNLSSAFYVAQATNKMLIESKKQGLMIYVGSRWANGTEKAPAYSASKAGLRGLVSSFQREHLHTGVRHILVSPGSVLTNMSRSVDTFTDQTILLPGDIGDLLLYLASTPASVIFDEICIKAYPYDYEH